MSRDWYKTAILAGLALLTVLTVAVLFWMDIRRERQRLGLLSNDVAASVVQHLSSAHVVLTGLVGLQHASDEVTTYEFSALSRELVSSYDHLQIVFKAHYLTDKDRTAYVGQKRVEGFPVFTITEKRGADAVVTAPTRKQYLPVDVVQPLEPAYGRLLGYDLLSDPTVSDSVQRAIDTGDVAMGTPFSEYQFSAPSRDTL